jgi:hypothetical protein
MIARGKSSRYVGDKEKRSLLLTTLGVNFIKNYTRTLQAKQNKLVFFETTVQQCHESQYTAT